jgi:hypothetical protein
MRFTKQQLNLLRFNLNYSRVNLSEIEEVVYDGDATTSQSQ